MTIPLVWSQNQRFYDVSDGREMKHWAKMS